MCRTRPPRPNSGHDCHGGMALLFHHLSERQIMRDSTRSSRGTPFWQVGIGILTLSAVLAMGIYLGRYERIERVDFVALPQETKSAALNPPPPVDKAPGKNAVPPPK